MKGKSFSGIDHSKKVFNPKSMWVEKKRLFSLNFSSMSVPRGNYISKGVQKPLDHSSGKENALGMKVASKGKKSRSIDTLSKNIKKATQLSRDLKKVLSAIDRGIKKQKDIAAKPEKKVSKNKNPLIKERIKYWFPIVLSIIFFVVSIIRTVN